MTEDEERERRRNFMSWWLPAQMARLGDRAAKTELEDMDARNCPNAVYGAVVAVHEAKAAHLAEAVISDGVTLSPAAMGTNAGRVTAPKKQEAVTQ